MTAFKVDENLPTSVAAALRAAGFDAVTVLDQALGGHPDVEIARVCRTEGRALLTLDTDFTDVRAFPPESHPGIVVIRCHRQDVASLLDLTRRLIALLASEPLEGQLWIVDEHRIRIRGIRP